MNTWGKPTAPAVPGEEAASLDRDHLAHYTLHNMDLEREIIALFLQQLPATLTMLDPSAGEADWRLATHTLKGSAAAVGATRINRLAAELEDVDPQRDAGAARELLAAMDAAVSDFRRAVGRIYS